MAHEAQPSGNAAPVHAPAGLIAKLKHELLSLLPAAVFFLVGFNLIALSKHVILAQNGIVWDGLTKATIGALLVAKVVALANLLPLMARLQRQTLWRSALAQAATYTTLCMAAHELEGLVRHAIAASGLAAGFEHWRAEFDAREFAFIGIWVFALFVVFVAFAELIGRSPFGTWRRALASEGKNGKGE